ncbi:ATP-binding protein [Streptomyces cyaneofuscatus]|uniref:ATP-binding protein n=1 Tax=Streptomyces cyaneofuscatus TaxID=66883 RepID=UPI0033BE8348
MEQPVAYEVSVQGERVSGRAVMRGSASYEMASGEIARVRDFVREFLASAQTAHGWDMSARAMDVAQLVASELATNVCKYAPGPCLVDLECDGTTLDIVMWDSGPILPAASAADPNRIGRHGLELVLMVCQSFEVRREPVGKSLRVQIALPDSPDNNPSGQTTW